MIFNTVTEELHDGTEGISVIPCYFEPVALEWTDRGTGSSAPVVHPVDTPLWNKTKKDAEGKARLPEGTYLERTHNHYCLLTNSEGLTSQVLISMKVSGLSKSRKWNSLVMSAKVKNGEQIINPPSWYYSYTLPPNLSQMTRVIGIAGILREVISFRQSVRRRQTISQCCEKRIC